MENDETVSHALHSPVLSIASWGEVGGGNGEAMQSMENDRTVSHPSHSLLENADEADVYHIPTATTAAAGWMNVLDQLPSQKPDQKQFVVMQTE